MGDAHYWRQTPTSEIERRQPDKKIRMLNETRNNEILESWNIPLDQRYISEQGNETASELGDANGNMTVWFSTVSLLVHEAATRGLVPEKSQFIDVGCGLGLAALYSVETLGFASALGIEYQKDRVNEANALISCAAVTSRSKARVSITHADAASYRLPFTAADSRFIFIFNAFGQETLKAFLRNNSAGFTSTDVIALANDITLLSPLIACLPRPSWVRNDGTNSSLVYPGGISEITNTVGNRTIQ